MESIITDQATHRYRNIRSQLVREALREYLLRFETKAREERDRAGYQKSPPVREKAQARESEVTWPEL